MILYKFSYCSSDDDLPDSVVCEFAKSFKEDWIESPIFSRLLMEVEKVTYIGGRLFRSNITDEEFDITCLSHGTINMCLAEHTPKFVMRFDSLGENLYKYLWDLQLSKDIYVAGVLNPYTLAEVKDVAFAEIGLVDFDVVVKTAEGFDEYLMKWLESNPDEQFYTRSQVVDSPLKESIRLKFMGSKSNKGFSLLLKYRFTFIEGESCSGKTRFIKSISRLSCSGEYTVTVLEKLADIKSLDFNKKLAVFIDLDDKLQSISELLKSKLSDNWVFVIVGHHLTSRLKIKFDSIYRIKYLPREKVFTFDLYDVPINSNSSFDVIVTEDRGSGASLFSILGKQVIGAGGFGKVASVVKEELELGRKVLVSLDYSTAETVLYKLVELQCQYKNCLTVIVPSSAEYCILYASGDFTRYKALYDEVFTWSDSSVLQYLSKLGKRCITVETLDFMVYSLLLHSTNVIDLKSYRTLEKFNIKDIDILKLVDSEIENLKPYNSQKMQVINLYEINNLGVDCIDLNGVSTNLF